MQPFTGVDLSKILGEQIKILGEQKVVKSDKCMGVSQLLGARARAAPKVYAYAVVSKVRLSILQLVLISVARQIALGFLAALI